MDETLFVELKLDGYVQVEQRLQKIYEKKFEEMVSDLTLFQRTETIITQLMETAEIQAEELKEAGPAKVDLSLLVTFAQKYEETVLGSTP